MFTKPDGDIKHICWPIDYGVNVNPLFRLIFILLQNFSNKLLSTYDTISRHLYIVE